ncbi:MAG TPA: hypothetical protein VFR06_09070 [Gallionellaceae bacterium]|nr:hypothetical protein [Gallionellaceae bacterium]
MVKIVIALVLFFVAGGSWLYLDCLNKQELGQTQSLQQGVQQARAEAKRRAESKALYERQAQAGLKSCQDAAEKAKTDYMALLQKTLPSKRGVVVVPQAAMDEAETILAAAKAACQQGYDEKQKQPS